MKSNGIVSVDHEMNIYIVQLLMSIIMYWHIRQYVKWNGYVHIPQKPMILHMYSHQNNYCNLITSGTYNTQELPCGIRVAANPWPVKMAINITSSSCPQGGLSPWGPQRARAVCWVPLIPDISLFGLLHAPSAPPMTVANHWPVAEIGLPSKFSG